MSSTYAVGDQPVPGAGYRLAEFLGRGGFGEVWKATAPGGAEAALKIIRLGGREGRKELRALHLVKRIHHTHLVPIIAFWIKSQQGEILDDEAVLRADPKESVSRGTAAVPTTSLESDTTCADPACPAELIIAMGLGERSLYDRLEQCRNKGLPGIPEDELLRYIEQSAEAIDFLNSPVHDLGSGPAGIQHCDIKPHNMVLVGGSVQVCDFGLARMMGADRATTAAASVAYAAPECILKGQPSATTDQYCLAVTFMELKTGELPYQDMSMGAVIEAKRDDKLDFHLLPPAVQAVMRRATASDPARRYASCREMVGELRRALAEPESAGRPRGRSRRLLVAALAAAVAAAGVWTWFAMPPTPGLPPPPVVPDGSQAALVPRPPANAQPSVRPAEPPGGSQAALDPNPSPNAQPSVKPPVSPNPEGDALLASGTKALQNNDFKSAVADLQRASKLLPHDARVFSRLGAAWFGQQKWDEAVKSYTAAIEIAPFDNDYLCRGRAYAEVKESDKAIADISAAVRLNPGNAAAYVELGGAYADKDDPPQALAAYSAAVKICGDDKQANFPEWNARLLRATTYLSLGKKAEAADDLSHACLGVPRDNPQSVQSVLDALDALATAYADAGQYADAAKWAKECVEFAPNAASKETYSRRLKQYLASASPSPARSPP